MAKRNGPPPIKIVTVNSHTTPGVGYDILRSRVDGIMYCSCPGWPFTKRAPGEQYKICKHMRRYLREPDAQPVAVAPGWTPAPKSRGQLLVEQLRKQAGVHMNPLRQLCREAADYIEHAETHGAQVPALVAATAYADDGGDRVIWLED